MRRHGYGLDAPLMLVSFRVHFSQDYSQRHPFKRADVLEIDVQLKNTSDRFQIGVAGVKYY